MITPLDIQNKEFKKSLVGYRTREVDAYLDSINEDYEKLYKENIELKDKISILTDQIRQYNNLEETLKSTLVIAQSTADEVTSSARKKAELIIEDAEITAKNKINEALDEVNKIMNEYENLKREIYIFKTRYESFIKAQLISIEEFYSNFEEKINVEDDKEVLIKDDDFKEVDHLGA
ncbi:MAG: DivIVA domain-containing protein [Tissierellia bacterium]|nr:DivIVA domain-containing protein [Tissierellia bacterium]